jgi:hypothetical protein
MHFRHFSTPFKHLTLLHPSPQQTRITNHFRHLILLHLWLLFSKTVVGVNTFFKSHKKMSLLKQKNSPRQAHSKTDKSAYYVILP